MFATPIYSARRARLQALLNGGLVLLPGNQHSPMNYRDNAYPFRQDSSFRYFFGLDQPGLAGLIDLDSGAEWLAGDEPQIDDIIWTGPLPCLAERAAAAGVQGTLSREELASTLRNAVRAGRRVHFLPPYRGDTAIELAEWLNLPVRAVASAASEDLVRAVVALRERKESEEIREIESALELTVQMHQLALLSARPGVVEHEVVGRMEGVMRARDRHLAYPIIFSKRGEILHNHDHSRTLETGDLVVNDTGSSSAEGYASDITRTIPVGGKFIGVKRELYELVVRAQQCTIEMLRPGFPFADAHRLACAVLVEGLKSMGCFRGDTHEIVESGAYAIVFQCGVGHQMGLDVHDMEALGEDFVGYDEAYHRSRLFGLRALRLAKPLQTGFVVTVEPGIYVVPAQLAQWCAERRFAQFIDYAALERLSGLGIRGEDDVLITSNGCRVLGPDLAKTADEVEAAMT